MKLLSTLSLLPVITLLVSAAPSFDMQKRDGCPAVYRNAETRVTGSPCMHEHVGEIRCGCNKANLVECGFDSSQGGKAIWRKETICACDDRNFAQPGEQYVAKCN